MQCMTIDVSRGTTHDGPGMRDTVFLKGCSLACRWCQNPESIRAGQEVWWEGRNCIGCLSCVAACEKGALAQRQDGIRVLRSACDGCGACAQACPSRAMSLVGKTWTTETLVREVMRDRRYYESFGGGVTVSGGEPLLQADFVAEFFRELRALGVHTALDTCGAAPEENLNKVLPYTCHLLYDVKLMDAQRHKDLTGRSNEGIQRNLELAAEWVRAHPDVKMWIRTPLIPDATADAENLEAIGRRLQGIEYAVERWELCAFNAACKAKYVHLDKPWPYEDAGIFRQAQIDDMKRAALASGFPEAKLLVSGMIKA